MESKLFCNLDFPIHFVQEFLKVLFPTPPQFLTQGRLNLNQLNLGGKMVVAALLQTVIEDDGILLYTGHMMMKGNSSEF